MKQMFVIEIATKVWGPFDSANAAAEYATQEFGGLGGGPWVIKPLRNPDD